ncbi:MAG: N-(5'-phosphoribosyl)anthranilate isomerase [Gemmatimonadales bacterium]
MATKVKFCGLTRPEDAREAAALGASYVGAVFAGGPRLLAPTRARLVFEAAGTQPTRVGVFGADSAEAIDEAAREAGVGIIQLHGDPRAADVRAMRERFSGLIWATARAEGSLLPEWADELFREADAVLLDARVPGALGGTGVALEWRALARSLDELRGDTPVVLAGGLRPGNVGEAIRLLAPDVVDVSSGVESAPGIKDHARMRAFVEAAQEAGT